MTAGSTLTAMSFAQALCAAQEDAMAEDDRVVLLGQDIQAGFPFGATKDLVARFGPDRVRNTPLSEAATMGCGVGLAMGGLRPVVEVDFGGFLLLGLDQLVNNAAKLRYMSGGQISVPLVVRVGQGPLGSFGAQHTYSQQAMLAAVPGLSVLTPATPDDAYAAMRWALRADHPVVLAEDMRLYSTRNEVRRGEVPEVLSAAVALRGDAATIVTYGHGVRTALAAAERLAERSVHVEVLSLPSLSPLDEAGIAESVRRTGRALCLTDDPPHFGAGATLTSVISAGAHDVLQAPVLRLGSRPVPAPYAPGLESLVFPSADAVVESVRRLIDWSG
ncbi:transketolase C-terminal domain-containing protein [Actinomadura sp. B10D3]|uniref:alpha-ketoacid dehydrogenase subunit beta n=1 Tax=Actinomadura sp. B10D3 TaxID=3153557 RepID=UPI00325EC152